MDAPRQVVAAITIQPAEAKTNVGKRLPLDVLAFDPLGHELENQDIVWKSADTSVATVSEKGEVTARRVGSTVITASDGSKTGTATLTVLAPQVASVALSPASATLLAGDTARFSAQPHDDEAQPISGRSVKWSVANPAIATVAGGVLVGLAAGLARPCFGATIAMKRQTLAAIGGFHAFVAHLADDNAIGEAVRRAGLRVTVPPLVVRHTCAERDAAELLRHELRWARTLRAADPLGYMGLVLTHPLPFAIAGALAWPDPYVATAFVASAILCRLALQLQVDRALSLRATSAWLGPARDLLSFGVLFASFFVGVVNWRGRRYKVRADGTLVPLGKPGP